MDDYPLIERQNPSGPVWSLWRAINAAAMALA